MKNRELDQKVRLKVFAGAIMLASPMFSSAATIDWGGAATGQWNNPALWTGSVRPTSADDAVVTISSSLPTITLTNDFGTTAADRQWNPANLSILNSVGNPAAIGNFTATWASNVGTDFRIAGAFNVGTNLNVNIVNGTGGGTKTLGAGSFNIGTGSTLLLGPRVAGPSAANNTITKTGAGRLAIANIAGNPTAFTVTGGVLEFRDVASGTVAGAPMQIDASTSVELQANAFRDYLFNLSGSGTVKSTGTRTARLAGNNTSFTGAMIVNSGNLAFNSDNGFGSQQVDVTANGTFGLEYSHNYNPARLLNPSSGGLRVAGGTTAVPVVVTATSSAPILQKKVTVVGHSIIDVTAMTAGLDMSAGGNLRGGTSTAGQIAGYTGNIVGDGSTTISVGDDFATANIGTMTINGNVNLNTAAGTGGGIKLFVSPTDTTVGGTINDLLQINGSLTGSTAPIVLRVSSSGAPTPGNAYTLVNYTGATPNVIAVGDGVRSAFSLDTATPGVIKVVAGASAAANLVWKGDGSANAWDVNTTQNFLNLGSPDFYLQGDNVLFDDTSSNRTVNLTGATLGPASFTVNTSGTYVFQNGTGGGLSTTVGVTKLGSGTLALQGNWSGSNSAVVLDIQQGKLDLGNGSSTSPGVGGRTIQLASGAELVMNVNSGFNFTAPVTGSGTLRKIGTATNTLGGVNSSFTGKVVIDGGILNLNNIAGIGTSDGGIDINGNGSLSINVGSASTSIGDALTINSTSATALQTVGSAQISFTSPATLSGTESHVDLDVGSRVSFTGGVSGNGLTVHGRPTAVVPGTLTLASDVSLNGAFKIDASASASIESVGSPSDPNLLRATGLVMVTPVTPADNATVFDIGNNALTINYAGASPAAAVRAAIIAGADGAVAGEVAILSTDPTANRKIGYAEANGSAAPLFGSVDSTTLLVRLTIVGDATLDGFVNFDDLLRLAQNYGSSAGEWYGGDFNYDGLVNFDDLLGLAQVYGTSLSVAEASSLDESFLAGFELAQSMIPEPSSVILLAAGAPMARRRRV